MSDVIIRPMDIDRDAEGIAAMWNASDDGWVGTFTRGVPLTAEKVREFEENRPSMVVYVAEVDGEIAGYCSFWNGHHGLHNEGYLALLNVSGKYQGRSIGRRLIQATIERSVQEGWQRQTLGTWSANFRAVPTYKKTGHFWTPDSSVWMQNFIPGALQMPLARPFFDRHDWYTCYVPELTQSEDDQQWEGLRVFTQRWRAGDESLTIWIDREARAPVAVETDDLQVAALIGEIEPLVGQEVPLRWRVINKSDEPLAVRVDARGDTGLTIDHREEWTVAPGETVVRKARVKVTPEIRLDDDGNAPSVRSIVSVNGREVELFSGVRARKPLSLDIIPGNVALRPGSADEVRIQLHSEMDRDLQVTVQCAPPPGVAVETLPQTVTVPARGHVSLPVQIAAAEEGVYSLPLRVAGKEGEELRPLNETLTLFCLDVGGLLGHREGSSVRLETDMLRVRVNGHSGDIVIESKADDRQLAEVSARIGPPYYAGEFERNGFSLHLTEAGGRATVHLYAEAAHEPGLFFHQEFTLTPIGLGVLRSYLENRTTQPVTRRVRTNISHNDREGYVALPLVRGTVCAPANEFPVTWQEVTRDPADYAEPWTAWEKRDGVLAVAWEDTTDLVDNGRGMALRSVELSAPAGGRSSAMQLTLYAGPGDWRIAREMVLRHPGGRLGDPPAVRRPGLARVEPAVIFTPADEVDARLRVDTVSRRSMDGRVTLTTDEGLSVDPATLDVAGLVDGKDRDEALRLTLAGSDPGVWRGTAHLSLPMCEERRDFAVVRLGDGRPVQVEAETRSGQSVWVMDNGATRMVVAPGFGPSVISWTRHGEEGDNLYSFFPEPRGFSWTYPWFGGIHSILQPVEFWGNTGYLHFESIDGEPVEARDDRGITWRGVRLSTRPQKRELRDIAVQIDLLTVGGSNVLKYIYRLTNLRATEQTVLAGNIVTAALGATPDALVLWGENVRQEPGPFSAWIDNQRWGALTHEPTGRTLIMVGKQSNVVLNNTGKDGNTLSAMQTVRLSGHETCELVWYLALVDDDEMARRYLVLRDVEG
jgi:GNAT superfamily N-acetyltransferase